MKNYLGRRLHHVQIENNTKMSNVMRSVSKMIFTLQKASKNTGDMYSNSRHFWLFTLNYYSNIFQKKYFIIFFFDNDINKHTLFCFIIIFNSCTLIFIFFIVD